MSHRQSIGLAIWKCNPFSQRRERRKDIIIRLHEEIPGVVSAGLTYATPDLAGPDRFGVFKIDGLPIEKLAV